MPDSIFDLKQTLFTSNLPVPTPRDRGSDKVSDFDQALNSAQRQNRDDHLANNSPEAPSTNNKTTDDTEHPDDAPREEHDEVTLSKHASEAAHSKPTEPVKGKKSKIDEAKATDNKKEPTADEIAAAAAAPQTPAKPVLKQLPQGEVEKGEQHEEIELNDAVKFGSKRGRVKPVSNETAKTNNENNIVPVTTEEPVAITVEAPAVESNAVVVATELHATKLANGKNNEGKGANKSGPDKVSSSDAKRTSEQTNASAEGVHDEGAFAVTVTPDADGETPAPKRRLETSRQTMPEVHESPLQLAVSATFNAEATASAASTETTTEAAASTPKIVETPAITTASPEQTPAVPNHLRGQQIPSSFANRLEAASAERKSNDGLNGVERTRFVQRVARAFQRVGETEGEIRLRLSPPELGAVKLEVSLRDGAMVARMETETTTARNLLMDNLPQLKERLAEQNVRIETFEVEVRDQSNHSSADDAKEQLREQNEQQRNRLRGERASVPVVAAPIVQTLSAARQSSQLNIVI